MLVYYELPEHGRSIAADVYWLKLDWVNKELCHKSTLVNRKYDNSTAHSLKQTQEKKIRQIKSLQHPVYSTDFHLFHSREHF